MLTVVTANVIMLSVIMLNVILLNVIMPSVIMMLCRGANYMIQHWENR
jgi:hypothetical protein